MTLFRAGGGQSAADIDVVATMTGLRTQCNDGAKDNAAMVYATASFDVLARRSDTQGRAPCHLALLCCRAARWFLGGHQAYRRSRR